MMGPGVSWPSASPSMNSPAVSHRNWRTTWSSTNARIASPPPNVNAPTFRKNTPSRHSAREVTAPAGARVAEHDAELGGQRTRQEVHQRHALDEAFARDPLALALDLRLHDAHHGRAAVADRAELQEDPRDFPGGATHVPEASRSANSVIESALVHSPSQPRVKVASR